MAKNLEKLYLLWFAQQHLSFREAEFKALANLFDLDFSFIEQPSEKPFLILKTNCENKMKQIMSRTVLGRSLFELWATAENTKDLIAKLDACPLRKLSDYTGVENSFAINVETFGKKISSKLKVEKIDQLEVLGFEGPIVLNDPKNLFYLIEYYGNDSNNIPEKPYAIFFARWIADGQRKVISKLSLKRRKFIAHTSMDTQLSLVMANLAKVSSNEVVLDPFVGSGSLLVAAANFGAFVVGTDIDYLLLHGASRPTRKGVKKRDSDENVFANLKQYNLQSKYLDILIADTSKPLWKNKHKQPFLFDAIITDPPYGVREGCEKIGTTKNYTIPEHLLAAHIPSKIEYKLSDIIIDLLNLSAEYLKMHGRLVFWMPVIKSENLDDKLPTHPCLQVISVSEQSLSWHTSRLLIVMKKIKESEEEDSAYIQINNTYPTKKFRQNLLKNSNKQV